MANELHAIPFTQLYFFFHKWPALGHSLKPTGDYFILCLDLIAPINYKCIGTVDYLVI